MKSITWQEIEQIAEAGDVLYGDFECLNWIWDDEKKDYQKVIEKTNKLIFWDCISCLTDKEDVRKGAKIFVHNDKMYEIIDNNPALKKLKQLEDIEEELGVDLVTLLKALNNDIYVKHEEKILHCVVENITNVVMNIDSLYYSENKKYDNNFLSQIRQVLIKDYGKTWALTREELEENKNDEILY